jgi:hypothetical protein
LYSDSDIKSAQRESGYYKMFPSATTRFPFGYKNNKIFEKLGDIGQNSNDPFLNNDHL